MVTDVGVARTDLEVEGLGDGLAELEESAQLVREGGRRSLALGLDVTDARLPRRSSSEFATNSKPWTF
ncbi:hypothetical protein ACFQX6_12415 [Streptosporangium lutulentum]